MTIVLKNIKDGSVAIMYPAENADIAETVKKFQEQHPEYTQYFEGKVRFPSDRRFRDAWELPITNREYLELVVNETKAMKIHLDQIRKARDEQLIELDKKQLRYITDSWKVAEIEKEKQALRDLPDKITDLDWPEVLV